MKIGIIGTGKLGSAVAMHLLDCKLPITIYNRTKQKTNLLKDKGANVVESPSKVAENSDLIIIIVKDANAVNNISFGKDGLVNAIRDKTIIADMSTINPMESAEITKKFQQYGINKLDIPVMGGPNVAITGQLVMMVSGNESSFNQCKSIFEKIAKKIFYLGSSGTANFIKLAMNLQISMLALSLSEGIILMEKSGIDPKLFLEILNSTYFKTGMSQKKAYNMIAGNHDATFTLGMLEKDLKIIVDTAQSLGIRLPVIEHAKNIYSDAVNDGFDKIDYTGIIEHLKKLSDSNS